MCFWCTRMQTLSVWSRRKSSSSRACFCLPLVDWHNAAWFRVLKCWNKKCIWGSGFILQSLIVSGINVYPRRSNTVARYIKIKVSYHRFSKHIDPMRHRFHPSGLHGQGWPLRTRGLPRPVLQHRSSILKTFVKKIYNVSFRWYRMEVSLEQLLFSCLKSQ
jgi:hypothetical protein